MQFSPERFRDFLNRFIAVPLNDRTSFAIEDFPKCEGADYILTYCYCDPQYGLMLEILAPAMVRNGSLWYGEGTNSNSYHLYMFDYRDLDYGYVTDDGSIAEHFWFKLALLREHDALTTIEATRKMDHLDEYRCETYIDQLFVGYGRDEHVEEFCPTTILNYASKYDPGVFIGRLDCEPEDTGLGLHKGDIVMFSYTEVDDVYVCYCNIDSLFTARAQFPEGFDRIAAGSEPIDSRKKSHLDAVIDYMSSNDVFIPCRDNPDSENGLLPMVSDMDGVMTIPLFMTDDDPRMPDNDGITSASAADVIEIVGNHDYEPDRIVLYIADNEREVEVPRKDFGTLIFRTRGPLSRKAGE